MNGAQDARCGHEAVDAWLVDFLKPNGGSSGTVHLYRYGGLRLANENGSVRAILGIAFPYECRFSDSEVDALTRSAPTLPKE